MSELLENPLFGVLLCIVCYLVGVRLNRRLKTPIANPLLIAIALIILLIEFTPLTLAQFSKGGAVVSMLLAPATAVLGAAIYRELAALKRNLLPVLCGCLVGTVVSLGSILLLCRMFKLDDALTASMLPKSVTTPIAMEVAASLGGIPAVAVAAVIFTGIFGASISPTLIRLLRVKDPIAAGVAIGASSHAVGTSKALELGEVQGAMSGIALGVTGLLTVFCALLIIR